MHWNNGLFKIIVALVIAAAVALAIGILKANKPEAKKRPPASGPAITVDVIDIEAKAFTPQLMSFGMVSARVNSRVIAQVGGRIVAMSEQFRDGGFFKKGDLLLSIEAIDYEIDVEVAKANLAQAQRALAEEQAQSDQARIDWERLGDDSEPSPLALRKPQLAAAEANVQSVAAQLKRAELNLSRTKIRAPFDGRVLSTAIDLGQVAGTNAVLGDIYATDAIEVRLPIKNSELGLINLPEHYSHGANTRPAKKTPVDIISDLAGSEVWRGSLVRTASTIDATSRQLYVVARIDDPFGSKAEGRFPLKIGQYVTASIAGITQDNAITIPNQAIYQGSYVYVFRDGAVYRQDIAIQWQNGEIAFISDGLNDGDQLVVSPLGQISSGTPVKLLGDTTGAAPADDKDLSLQQWIKNLPPHRLERLTMKAERDGKTLEEIAKAARENKGAHPKPSREGAKP